MLRRLVLAAAVTVCLSTLAFPARASSSDDPDVGVTCPPTVISCTIIVKKPGSLSSSPSNGNASFGRRTCAIPDDLLGAGQRVDCADPDFGSWNNADGCYYRLASPHPAKSDPAWEGHTDGAIYASTCFGTIGTGGGPVWRATAPPGVAAVTPEQLAQQAVKQLPIHGPDIQ